MRFDPIRRAFGAAAALLLLLTAAHAGPYTKIYAFGDSLSDVGNIFTLSGGTTPLPPYYNGQYSNGNVWLQTLASQAGLAPLVPSLLPGGTNFAYGGAQSGQTLFHTAGLSDVVGASGQIAQFQTKYGPAADPNALYTIWIGGNDLLGLPGSATQVQVQTLAVQTVGNIDSAIVTLAAMGAKKFLVVTLPDVGKTPQALSGGPAVAATASAVAASFNSLLLGGNATVGIPSLAQLSTTYGLNLKVWDSYAFIDGIVANPAANGFANVTTACYNGTTVCASPNQYAFWDAIHPTGAAHLLAGQAAANVLSVPEPGTWALMLAGLGGVLAIARRRGAVSRALTMYGAGRTTAA